MEVCAVAAGKLVAFSSSWTSSPPSSASACPKFVTGLTISLKQSKQSINLNSRAICKASSGGSGALTPELKVSVEKYLKNNKVVLFMKGTKLFPQCGFSNTVVQILNTMNVPYETVNILEDDVLRQGLKIYSSWPTFPQLYIEGEFFGGCDITLEAYKSGQLKELLEKAICS